MTRDWWAPLTGVLFVVLLILSFVVGGEPPDSDEPVGEIVAHYVDNKDAITFSMLLFLIAGTSLIYFTGILRDALRSAGGVLPTVAFAGSIVMVTGAAVDMTILFALAESAEDIEPTAVQALQALWDNDFVPMALGLTIFLTATGLAIVRSRALPVWLGWAALVLGVAAATPVGFVAFMGGALWVLVASVLLTLRRRAEGPVVRATA